MKKLVLLFAIAVCAGFAHASDLWWTISNPMNGKSWDTATIYAVNASGVSAAGLSYTASDVSSSKYVTTTLGDYASSAYSFYIELTQSNAFVAQTQSVSYSALVGSIVTSGMDTTNASVYDFTNAGFAPIPEPTGGLLMLIGLGALALKRKEA